MAVAKTTVTGFTGSLPARSRSPTSAARAGDRRGDQRRLLFRRARGGATAEIGLVHVTETLEVIPRRWKVIQHVREKFTCRDREKISQVPAPFHAIARGSAGPSLLAMILFE